MSDDHETSASKPVLPPLASLASTVDISTALCSTPSVLNQLDPLTLKAPAPMQHDAAPVVTDTPLPPEPTLAPPSALGSATMMTFAAAETDNQPPLGDLMTTADSVAAESATSGKQEKHSHQQEPHQQAAPINLGQGRHVLLEFLLLSGKRMRLNIGEKTTVKATRQLVWERWPTEWRGQEELPPSTDSLRLQVSSSDSLAQLSTPLILTLDASSLHRLYLGKFLEDDKTLSACGIGSSGGSSPTIVHLNVRPIPSNEVGLSRE